MTLQPVNMDAASDRTLAAIAANLDDPRSTIARWMLASRQQRKAGNVASAMRYEDRAERLIEDLPEALQW